MRMIFIGKAKQFDASAQKRETAERIGLNKTVKEILTELGRGVLIVRAEYR